MGDFNEWLPGNRNLRRVHRQFGQTPAPRTYPSWWPVLALDRIWVAPRAALRALWVHSEPAARVASDHLPVVGEIVWSTCPDQAPS